MWKRFLLHQHSKRVLRIIAVSIAVIAAASVLEAHHLFAHVSKGYEFVIGSIIDHAIFEE